ncbi:MAG: transposase [Verrucomicrobiia bacterium]|jgi:REP element-mobilizing transposase RayT
MERKIKRTPPRLSEVFQNYGTPVYFITICTLNRQAVLAFPCVHEAFRSYAARGREFGVAVGRYVIMPDHLHVFAALDQEMTVSRWVKGLKRCLDDALQETGHELVTLSKSKLSSFWQPGAFDHLLRSTESYEQKWHYVWQNPVRAGLVSSPEGWPYQGEIVPIDRA